MGLLCQIYLKIRKKLYVKLLIIEQHPLINITKLCIKGVREKNNMQSYVKMYLYIH